VGSIRHDAVPHIMAMTQATSRRTGMGDPSEECACSSNVDLEKDPFADMNPLLAASSVRLLIAVSKSTRPVAEKNAPHNPRTSVCGVLYGVPSAIIADIVPMIRRRNDFNCVLDSAFDSDLYSSTVEEEDAPDDAHEAFSGINVTNNGSKA